MDSAVLMPFTESERYLLQHAFKMLADTNFFERHAQQRTLEEIASFDSRTSEEKLLAIERLSGIRSVLLYLHAEAKQIAESVELASVSNDDDLTGDSDDVIGTPLFPYLESQQ